MIVWNLIYSRKRTGTFGWDRESREKVIGRSQDSQPGTRSWPESDILERKLSISHLPSQYSIESITSKT